jgi:hypothetical protein
METLNGCLPMTGGVVHFYSHLCDTLLHMESTDRAWTQLITTAGEHYQAKSIGGTYWRADQEEQKRRRAQDIR